MCHMACHACLQDTVLSTIQDWAQEPAYKNNATVLLVIGLIYAAEDNYVEALRACHSGISLELYVSNWTVNMLLHTQCEQA